MVTASVREAAAPAHKRFLANRPKEYDTYIRAARNYVANVGSDVAPWLYRKPYDNTPGNASFYIHIYNVLNILKVMEIPCGGTVLEVGSGPGWLTEILFCLGFEVFALEPSEAMILVARERIAASTDHYRIKNPPRVTFLCASLEECPLPDESVDAVLFHEALHHVVDEERGIAHCARVLRRGGVLGVTGEASWAPGRRGLEDACREEMKRYGTLENPYTAEYLEYLLHKHGFRDVVRYHGINGFFPVHQESLTIKQAAQHPADACNHLTARKQISGVPTTNDSNAVAHASLTLLESRWDRDAGKVRLSLRLLNSGSVTWLHRSTTAGWVTLSLFRDPSPDGGGFREATNRVPLPKSVLPAEELILNAEFDLPGDPYGSWHVGLVCENRYWFHARGTEPVEIQLV